MKKILIVDFNGTSPTYTYYFSKGIVQVGNSIDILGEYNREYLHVHQEKLNYIGLKTLSRHLNYIFNWLLLFFIAHKYNAIHIQWLPMLKHSRLEVLLIICLQYFHKNILYTVHNVFPHDCSSKKIKNRYIALYKSLKKLLIHTEKSRLKLQKLGINSDKIILIQHGPFYSEFFSEYVSKHQINLLMLGNILPYKGVEDAFKVVKLLKEKGHDVQLEVIGKCPTEYFKKLKTVIVEYQINSIVSLNNTFVSSEDLIKKYKKATVSLLPYKQIEQSGVLYTSIGLGVPVAAFKIGGIQDTIVDGTNGFLAEPGDIEKLAEAVLKCQNQRKQLMSNIKESLNDNPWKMNGIALSQWY